MFYVHFNTIFISASIYKWNALLIGYLVVSIKRVARTGEKMARLSLILTIVAVVLACAFAEQELYSSRYDDVDLDGILTNEKLRLQYYNCFMDRAPCKTADAKFFKGISMHETLYTYFSSLSFFDQFKIDLF